MALHFLANALSRRLRRLYLAARQIERVCVSLGGELALHHTALHRTDCICLHCVASVHRALADSREIHVRRCGGLAAESLRAGVHVCRRARIVVSSGRGYLEYLVQVGFGSDSASTASRWRAWGNSGICVQLGGRFDSFELLVELAPF